VHEANLKQNKDEMIQNLKIMETHHLQRGLGLKYSHDQGRVIFTVSFSGTTSTGHTPVGRRLWGFFFDFFLFFFSAWNFYQVGLASWLHSIHGFG